MDCLVLQNNGGLNPGTIEKIADLPKTRKVWSANHKWKPQCRCEQSLELVFQFHICRTVDTTGAWCTPLISNGVCPLSTVVSLILTGRRVPNWWLQCRCEQSLELVFKFDIYCTMDTTGAWCAPLISNGVCQLSTVVSFILTGLQCRCEQNLQSVANLYQSSRYLARILDVYNVGVKNMSDKL